MITVPMNPNSKKTNPLPNNLDPTPRSDAMAKELAAILPRPDIKLTSLLPPPPPPRDPNARPPTAQVRKMRALNKQQHQTLTAGLEPGVERLIMQKVLPAKRVAIEKFTDRAKRPGFTDTNDPYTPCLREIERRIDATPFANGVDRDDLTCRAITTVAAEHDKIVAATDPNEQERMQHKLPQKVIEGFLRNKFPKLRFLETLPDAIKLPGGETFALNPSPADPAQNTMIAGPEGEDVATGQGGFINVALQPEPLGGPLPGVGAGPQDSGQPNPQAAEDPQATQGRTILPERRPEFPANPDTDRPDQPDLSRFETNITDTDELVFDVIGSESVLVEDTGEAERDKDPDSQPVGEVIIEESDVSGNVTRTSTYSLIDIQRLQARSPEGRASINASGNDEDGTFEFRRFDRERIDFEVGAAILENIDGLAKMKPPFFTDRLSFFSPGQSPEEISDILEEQFGLQYTIARDRQTGNIIVSFAPMDPNSFVDVLNTANQHLPIIGQFPNAAAATPQNAIAFFIVDSAKRLAQGGKEEVSILVTGHSLGAGLGSLAAAACNVPGYFFASIGTLAQRSGLEDALPSIGAGTLTGDRALDRARRAQHNIRREGDFLARRKNGMQSFRIEPSEEPLFTAHSIADFARTIGRQPTVTLQVQETPADFIQGVTLTPPR